MKRTGLALLATLALASLAEAKDASSHEGRVVSVKAPTSLQVGAAAGVTIVLRNTGGLAWGERTRLGTSSPRDHVSPFAGPHWVSKNRAAEVGPVAPGARTSVAFEIVAPSQPGRYTLAFELVEDGTAWFNGTGDDLRFEVEVKARPEGHGLVGICGLDTFDRTAAELERDVAEIVSTHAQMCRIGFRTDQGPWASYKDTRPGPKSGKGWLEAARDDAAALHRAKVAVYGLLELNLVGANTNDAFLAQAPTGCDPEALAAVDAYAQACEDVIRATHDTVSVYEIVNEPNVAGVVRAEWEALILQEVYERVRLAHRDWKVTIVSGSVWGGLVHAGKDGYAEAPCSDYLEQIYDAGCRRQNGRNVDASLLPRLDWQKTRRACGSYPLDGIGYHIYTLGNERFEGDPNVETGPEHVAPVLAVYLDAVLRVIDRRDPEGASKKIWISEFGWHATIGGEAKGEKHQADLLTAAFKVFVAEPRVAAALYFCLRDFTDSGKVATYGLFSAARARPSFASFVAAASAARLRSVASAPATAGFVAALDLPGAPVASAIKALVPPAPPPPPQPRSPSIANRPLGEP